MLLKDFVGFKTQLLVVNYYCGFTDELYKYVACHAFTV